MEATDLLFFLFVLVVGGISTIVESMRKRRQTGAPPTVPKVPVTRSRNVQSEMDRILADLGLAPPKQEVVTIGEEWESTEEALYEAPPSMPEAPPLIERSRSPQVVSLETLEPAGGESHDRFHRLYMKQPDPDEAGVRSSARVRHLLNRRSLREAVLLTEILGPPKGLQD